MGRATGASLALMAGLVAAPAWAQTVQVPGLGPLACGPFLSAFGAAEGGPPSKVAGKTPSQDPKTAAKGGDGAGGAGVSEEGAAFAAQIQPRQQPRPRDAAAGPPQGRDMGDWLAYCRALSMEDAQ
ncbi:MAG: hypothetical protein AAFR93_12120 [Pseudomonadota bacterium]